MTTLHANRTLNPHTAKEAASLSGLLVHSRLVHAMLLRIQALVRPKTPVMSGHLGACQEEDRRGFSSEGCAAGGFSPQRSMGRMSKA
jgi:hypothetical protein